MKNFIFGLEHEINDSSLSDTRDLWLRVGENSGNLAFHYSLKKMLNQKLVSTPWGDSINNINAAGNLGIMPCANQIGQHIDLGDFAEKIRNITPNLIVVGLGAQGSIKYDIPFVPQGTLDWVAQLIEHSKAKINISVRGSYTQHVLDHYGFEGKTVPLGCPSLFLNPKRNLGEILEKKYKTPISKIAIAAGHPNWKPIQHIELGLVELSEKYNGSYIVQADKDMMAMARNDYSSVDMNFCEKLRNYIKPDLNPEEFKTWSRNKFNTFYSISAWMEYLRKFDFVVGSRIHGVMLAIQAGIPGLCIAHDSRIRELCETSCIPWISAYEIKPGFTLNDLLSQIHFDGASFDKNREELWNKYQLFFEENGINEIYWS